MSLKYEQYRSLKMTRDFIHGLFTKDGCPETKKELRERAGRVIRHFPPLKESGEPMFSRDGFEPPENGPAKEPGWEKAGPVPGKK